MPLIEAEGSWLSAHIFYKGTPYDANSDYVILNVLEPFVRRCLQQGWITTYFFIRYSERGAHMRLRLYGERALLEREVKPALEAHVHNTLPDDVRAYPQADGATQETPSPGDTSSVLWIPYEPETDRYGGPYGVALAENLFYYSSETALAFLAQLTGKDHSARLGKGLLAMIVLVYVFLPKRAAATAFFQSYGTSYLRAIVRSEEQQSLWLESFDQGFDQQAQALLPYVEATWERLDAGEPLTETLDGYYQRLCLIRQHFEGLLSEHRLLNHSVVMDTYSECVGKILPSYIHMMNNRLGVPIPEESYLAYVIRRALQQTMEHDTPEPSMVHP